LGDGIITDLLDFTDVNNIPDSRKKKLKFTDEDQEYFSGTKKRAFNNKPSKVRILRLMYSFLNSHMTDSMILKDRNLMIVR
jgi:hypothetical protein